MGGTPQLTPRTKQGQVAPADSPLMVEDQDATVVLTSARVAPAGETTVSDQEAFKAHVRQEVRTSGRLAFKDTILFFGRMLIPFTIVSTWVFGIFAFLSWLVPSYTCEEHVKEFSGSSLGLSPCVYNTEGKYSPMTGSKFFFLFFWAAQNGWNVMFPGVICHAMFGSHMGKFNYLATALWGVAGSTIVVVSALVWEMALNNGYILAVGVFGGFSVVFAVAKVPARFTNNNLMQYRYILLFFYFATFSTIYSFILPRIITRNAQDALGGQGLTIMRLVVHPALWAVAVFYFRVVMRHLGRMTDLTQASFYIWPVLYSSLYGRFLLLQLESAGSVVVLNFMFACFNIASKLEDRGSDGWWYKLIYGERTKEAMTATKVTDDMELLSELTNNMMEGASILGASALLSFGRIATTPGVPPNHSLIWYNAFLQMVTTLVFNFVELVACGKFHNYQWKKVYPRSMFRLVGYVMLILTFGSSKLCMDLLMLFCPKYYDEHGVLLEQCDKPSLFDAISFSRRPTVSGDWLDATPVNGTWIPNAEL